MTFLLNNSVVEVLASNGQPVTGLGNWQNLSNIPDPPYRPASLRLTGTPDSRLPFRRSRAATAGG